MTTAILEAKQEFDVEDVEYLRHGDKPLLARVHKPSGEGPFPALVECHGGAPGVPDAHTGDSARHARKSRPERGHSRLWWSVTAGPGASRTGIRRSSATRPWPRTGSCRSRSI